MKLRKAWKRTLAWGLMLTMIVGNNSSAVYAEDVMAAVRSVDVLEMESDISADSANSGETEEQKKAEEFQDETANVLAKPVTEDTAPEDGAELVADETLDTGNEIQDTVSEKTDDIPNETFAARTEEPKLIVEGMEVVTDVPEDISNVATPTGLGSIAVPKSAVALTGEDDFDVEITDDADCKWYSFAPNENGSYIISMYGYDVYEEDPIVDLYMKNESGTLDYVNDSRPENSDYWLKDEYEECYLSYFYEAGKTYYFKFYSQYEGMSFSVHFRKLSEPKSISLSFPDDLVLVSGIHSMMDAYGALKVTLTYENGKSNTIEDYNTDDFRDEYGTRITYENDYDADEDDDLSGTHTITVSAPEWNCSESIPITFLSMKDAAVRNMLGGDNSITLRSHENVFPVVAGFKPAESGRYVISGSNVDSYSISVYDTENPNGIFNTLCPYSIDAVAGKTYLIAVYPDRAIDEGGSIEVSARRAKKIESIELEGLQDEYDVSTVGKDLSALTAKVSYEGDDVQESVNPGDWDCWHWDFDTDPEGKLSYSANTAEGYTIVLSLWDGKQQIDMPNLESVIGALTLKVKVGSEVYQEKQITIRSGLEKSTEMVPGQSYEAVSDAKGNVVFTFNPDKTGVYSFQVTGENDSVSQYILIALYRTYGNKNEYVTSSYDIETGNLEQVLQAGESYWYCVETGTPNSRVKAELTEVEMETFRAEMPVEELSESGKWFIFQPDTTAIYEWTTSAYDIDASVYDSDFELIGDDLWREYYLVKDNTYYIRIRGNTSDTITMNKNEVKEFHLNQKISDSKDGWFSFKPTKSKVYGFLLDGLVVTEDDDDGDLENATLYDEQLNEVHYDYYDIAAGDEEQYLMSCELEAGHTYLLKISLYVEEDTYSVMLLESKEIKSIQWGSAERQDFPSGVVDIEGCVQVLYEDYSLDECWLENDDTGRVNFSYYVRTELYETDADGKPDYAKRLETSDDEDWWGSYLLKPGAYAWVADIGYYNEDDDFIRLDDIAPIIMTIFVSGQAHTTHTFETVTEKEATCSASGRTVSRCSVCGYVDPSSERTIAATGRHTGGTATCFKKAICAVCGKEYGSLTPRFIRLNADSLQMKTKQKTTKLTVSMGAGDSIASVKSSNTKILKAVLKKGRITLTAQKNTGTAKLTIVLASGESKTIKVKVQKKAVVTKRIKGVSRKITLGKKQKTTLKPELYPITSQDKVKYSSSNRKVATVNSKGVVTAKKAGESKITIRAGKKTFKCTIVVK